MFKAAILAAGEGSRLKAQGITTPKPLVLINGVPMIERILRQFRAVGASEAACMINEEFLEVRTHVQTLALDMPIRTVIKSTPSSFHSLCELRPLLQGQPFLLSMVDSIFATNELAGFVRYAQQRGNLEGLLAVTDFVADENPLRIQLGTVDQVVAIGPGAMQSSYVTGGIYWFSEKIWEPVAQARAMGVSRMRNFLAFLLHHGYALEGYHFGKIIDVDTAEDIDEVEKMERK